MTENNTTIDRRLMFLKGPDGVRPFSDFVETVEITEEPPELDILGNTPRYVVQQPTEYTADITLTPEGSKFFADLTRIVNTMLDMIRRLTDLWQSYPNKRVKHLALYGKKLRTRKKNMRRIARELLKEVKK